MAQSWARSSGGQSGLARGRRRCIARSAATSCPTPALPAMHTAHGTLLPFLRCTLCIRHTAHYNYRRCCPCSVLHTCALHCTSAHWRCNLHFMQWSILNCPNTASKSDSRNARLSSATLQTSLSWHTCWDSMYRRNLMGNRHNL